MSDKLIPVKSVATFQFAGLLPADRPPTPTRQAAMELVQCTDDLLLKAPYPVRDFLLRSFRSFGLPIDYPGLPFWVERAARHVFTICYPTLRKADWTNPSPEDFGKLSGHLAAMVAHSKEGTAIFQRLPKPTAEEFQAFFAKVEPPLRVLIDEGWRLPPAEAEAFIRGLNHAYARTFDAVGLPRGWNTNSPVLLGLCLGWRYIVTQSPTLSALRNQFAKLFGEQEIGTDDRVKKICQRLGLRFAGNRAADCQGTSVILDVPTETKVASPRLLIQVL